MLKNTSTSSCCKPWKTSLIARLLCLTLTLCLHIIIGLVALIGLVNFGFPLVNDYKGLIEKEISAFLGNTVTIGAIRADRNSETPRWIVSDLQLTDPSGNIPIHIQQLTLTLDWQESLRTLRLQPADINVQGMEFILRQEKNALPTIQGLKFPLPGLKNTALNIERKTPIRINIEHSFVHWMDISNHRTLTLNELSFIGEILTDAITLQAEAFFPPQIGKSLAVDAVLKQIGVNANEPIWNGELNTRGHIFNIAALPSPLLRQWGVEKGELKFDTKIKAQANRPLLVQGEGEIIQLGLKGNKQIPAVQGINARFKADNKQGLVDISANDSTINYPQWFEKPIAIERLSAQLKWLIQENGWLWAIDKLALSNKDIQASGAGSLKLIKNTAPDLNLHLNFATQRLLDNVRDYIPSVIVDGTEKWLKTAIVAGFVPQGEFILQGNPADFPFQNKKGVFDIRFDIEKGILAYLPEWPGAKEVQGELRFHNAGMTGKIKSARIMNLDVIGGKVDIPDMLGETHLLLNLQTKGDLKGHMDYLQTAPIGRSLQDFMQMAEFKGPSALNLKLDVPLDAPVFAKKGVKVDGWVELMGNTFSMPEYEQTFSNLQGQVHFDQIGVDTEKVSGIYRNSPIIIQADTDKIAKKIKVNLTQQNALNSFLPDSVRPLSTYLTGQTPINVELSLPAFTADHIKTEGVLQVEAKSQLQGIAIQLPPPFAKAPNSLMPAHVLLTIPFDAKVPWQSKITLDSLLAINMQLAHKSQAVTAIGIDFGGSNPTLPQAGIKVMGTLPQMDLLQWRNFSLNNKTTSSITPKTTDSEPTLNITAQVAINDLRLGQQTLGAAKIQAQLNQVLQATILASKAQASLVLPRAELSKGQVNLAFKNIDLDSISQSLPPIKPNQPSSLLPSALPAIQLSCQQCRKGDMPIEQLSLDMQKQDKDLAIRRLEIRNNALTLTATKGQWYIAKDGKPYTQLNVDIHSPQMGKLLADENKPSDLQGGELKAKTVIQWAGAPFEFALEKINGQGHITVNKGSITAVDPGVGRVLGLLDLKLFSRRLALDFHDITAKGFVFDEIAGDFVLKQGIVSTLNTIIKSPILIAGIKGESDLVHKTHNQTITVIPNLRSTLPLVGTAVAGIGGGIAAVLFNEAMERSAEEKLQGRGGLRYRVTGSWDNPEINGSKSKSSPENEPANNSPDPLNHPPG